MCSGKAKVATIATRRATLAQVGPGVTARARVRVTVRIRPKPKRKPELGLSLSSTLSPLCVGES